MAHQTLANTIAWSRLRLFNYYRTALALFLFAIYLNGWIDYLIRPDYFNSELYGIGSFIYLLFSLIFILSIQRQQPNLVTQVLIQTTTDILLILLLMYAAGGMRTGLGMLLIINISMTSLFLPLRSTLLLAAFASLVLLVTQIYTHLSLSIVQAQYVQTGMLGILLFIVAFLSSSLATRLRQTELLAEEQSLELETAVQLSEQVIRNMRTGILVVQPDGTIAMVNKAARNLLSNAYIGAESKLDEVSPKLWERFVEWQFNTDAQSQKPIQQSHGLPDIQPGFSNIEPQKDRDARTLVFLEDATQLNQRFQQMKLASLGRLTASIAHEIRNPLAAIHHASQLLEEADLAAPDAKLTNIINTQVNRLNTIVENVLHISRQQRGTPEQLNLLQWLNSFSEEFCSSKKITHDQFKLHIEPEDTMISFDPNQLHQVAWNLCSNSLHHAGIDIDNIIIDIHGGFSIDAEQPYIDIIDNGVGIDPETAQQIFEPFYTTSPEGTGLGLYITKEVIESNRAKISHIVLPTGGTCFRIYFIQKPGSSELSS